MSERFEGRAILFELDGVEYLHVIAVWENGDTKPHRMAIPVRPKGAPQGKHATWEYETDGKNRITVRPSVEVTNDGTGTPGPETFHSDVGWGFEFERFTPTSEIVWIDGIGDHGQRRRMKELNPGDIVI